jgi:hypothetical protein
MADQLRIGPLRAQFAYLRKLRRMKYGVLKAHHQETFEATKWQADIRGVPRRFIERRLYFWFVWKNCHYPRGSKERYQLVFRCKQVLGRVWDDTLQAEEATRARLRDKGLFTKDAIRTMPIREIDRFLALLGVWADVSEGNRRRMLWEWHNDYWVDLEGRETRAGKVGPNNRWVLRSLIAENPEMDYDLFLKRYGAEMPTTTRKSFNNQRAFLRKAGYDLPKLPQRKESVTVGGKKTS